VPEYDRTSCYTLWQNQFQALTKHCSEEQKATKMVEALRGQALVALSMLQQQGKEPNYQHLDDKLTKTFSAVF